VSALNRCVTRSSRCVGAKGIAVEERRVGAKSVRHTKLALRDRVKGIPIIAVEEAVESRNPGGRSSESRIGSSPQRASTLSERTAAGTATVRIRGHARLTEASRGATIVPTIHRPIGFVPKPPCA
jgi:hypothetical protein